MKAITLLTSMILSLSSCNCQKTAAEKSNVAAATTESEMKQENLMPTIEYEATSRGVFLLVRVENQHIYVSRNRDAQKLMKATPISDKDWKEIETLAKAVKLETVKDLKWPTEKRFYDGAAHANITFSVGREKYVGNGFDHGYPPKEIEQLVNKIVALADKIE
ncbi:hypothetical protein [Flavobacterium pedocola]